MNLVTLWVRERVTRFAESEFTFDESVHSEFFRRSLRRKRSPQAEIRVHDGRAFPEIPLLVRGMNHHGIVKAKKGLNRRFLCSSYS